MSYDTPQTYRWKDPTLPPNAPALHMYFMQEPQVNQEETAKTGIQTFDNVLVAYVSPSPQSKSNVAHEIRRSRPDGTIVENKAMAYKYAEQLKHYDAGTAAEALGTPLKELVGMTPAMIMNLKSRGISTVETLSELSDSVGQDFMGFWEWRDRAKKHLELREKNAPMLKVEALEERHKSEVASLRKQIEDLTTLIDKKTKPKAEAA